MAFNITNFSKASIIIRSVRNLTEIRKCVQFSTSQILVKENPTPVKFTTNKAAKVSISETIGLEAKSARLWYEKYVLMASIVSILIYFCILREENDLDEILSGNSEYFDPKIELVKLKTQLKYCEKNKLPTAKLKARIEELEEGLRTYSSPFRM